MTRVDHYYRKATFRPGAEYLVGETKAVFSYDGTRFDVDCNAPAAAEIEKLCADLTAGLPMTELAERFPEFEPHARTIVEALDRYGLLTEGDPPPLDAVISGSAFWQEVDVFTTRLRQSRRPVFHQALEAGTVPREALIRYAREYYHIVRAGPGIIAGMLAHAADDGTRRILESFLTSEIGHDRLLLRALAAAGEDPEAVADSLPLPETFALIAALQVHADQEPLTFKALVFLMEEASPEFHAAFRRACEAAGLDRAFWQPIIDHADINDEGEHGSISARLLDRVPVVSTEERLVVLKHATTLIETLVALEHALLR